MKKINVSGLPVLSAVGMVDSVLVSIGGSSGAKFGTVQAATSVIAQVRFLTNFTGPRSSTAEYTGNYNGVLRSPSGAAFW